MPENRLDKRQRPFRKPKAARKAPQSKAPTQHPGERVAKVIARAGLCSRRDAEAWIAQGRVAVNGIVLSSPATNVGPADTISVDGKPLAERQRTRLFLFHKPRGLVTTNKDPEGRPTIFDYLHEHHPEAPRLVSVGRLDINTEGLLLLTNDGGLARVLELPSTGWLRRYRVRANGETDQASLNRLADGVTIDGIHYASIEATLDRAQGANCWLTMSLREGKNREIKRVLEHLGLTVNRLIRLSFGPFQLGDLADGALEEVRSRVLRDQLGPALLKESGADLDAPIHQPPEMPRNRAIDSQSSRQQKPRPRHATSEANSEKRRDRPKPGPRKHVSALRAEAENHRTLRGSPRQRTERGETEDRKGRSIAVERRVASPPPQREKRSPKPKWPRAHKDKMRDGRRPRPPKTR